MTAADRTAWSKKSSTRCSAGPLEPLLKEPSISDILVNRFDKVYIERGGKLGEVPVRFRDNAHLLHIIEKIVSQVGRRIDEAQPIVDARLPMDPASTPSFRRLRSTAPASHPPFRPPRDHAGRDDSVQDVMPGMLRFLAACVQRRTTILISGGTGSGKTTMLNASPALSPRRSASSPSKTRPNCNCNSATWSNSKPARPILIRKAASISATCCERSPHAPGPHYRRRVPRRGSAGHAAGHEHRRRGLHEHRPRQYAARCLLAARNHGDDGGYRYPRAGASCSNWPPPSSWWCRLRACQDGARRRCSASPKSLAHTRTRLELQEDLHFRTRRSH